MTLANKNQILWLELQWCLIIAAEADEWPCEEYVGLSEPRDRRAVRANDSISSQGEGQSGL